jgi:NADPH-dependent 2,4-dienoyl-CoA reductase/sulfur reductase-like enzyme
VNDTNWPDDTDQSQAPDQQQPGAAVPAEPGGRWQCSLEELPSAPRRTDRVAVVGAGMVGLATAWFLQQRGVDVDVLERNTFAAGSSWGNAGWLAPP